MRAEKLMQRLMNAAEPLRMSTLAQELGTSVRTIQSDLSYLRQSEKDHGFRIVSERGRGIRLVVEDAKKLGLFISFLSGDETIAPADRPASVLQALILAGGYTSAEALARGLGMSTSMVNATLPETTRLASSLGIEVVRTRHHGTCALGGPRETREYLANAYLEGSRIVKSAVEASLGDEGEVSSVLATNLAHEENRIRYEDFCSLKALVTVCAANLVSDSSEDEATLPNIGQKYLVLASEISQGIAEKLGSALSSADVTCIAQRLESLSALDDTLVIEASEVSSMTVAFLAEVDEQYGTSYCQDSTFLDMLDAHMALLVKRLLVSKPVSVSFAQRVELGNTMSMDLAVRLCEKISKRFGITPTPDEASLIAMHFAAHEERVRQNRLRSIAHIVVVCATGGGAATLVKMQLAGVFPEAKIDAVSYLDQSSISQLNPDLILTMVPLLEKPCAPTVYIDEILSPSDLADIGDAARHGRLSAAQDLSSKLLITSLLKRDLFACVEPTSYAQVVRDAALDCSRLGYAEDSLASLVETRERFASTIYLNGVSAPHPVEAVGISNAIAVRLLRSPLKESGKEVRIVFLACLKKESIGLYKRISSFLFPLMNDPKKVALLASSSTFDEFASQIKNMEASHYGR